MQLCDKDIHKAIVNGDIGFVGTNEKFPFLPEQQVQPSSIDLRLGDIIVRFKDTVKEFDIRNKIVPDEYLNIQKYGEGKPITINPGEIIYGQVYEQMWIGDNYSARIVGRSRVARLGLAIHCTGSYINPGFCGAMPLQIINNNKFPIIIYPYIGICQLVLFQISDEPLVKYSERSRIYNPYFDEKIASPSVLKSDPMDGLNNQSIVEKRMTQLVKDYYQGLETQKRNKYTTKQENKKIATVVMKNTYMRDQYIATQVGAQGPAAGQNATINQVINNSEIDFSELLKELEALRNHLKKLENGDNDIDILIGDVSKASKAIKENRKFEVVPILKNAGSKLFDIAKSIGCTIVVKILTNQLGL